MSGLSEGHVRVFRDSLGNWVQVGSDIEGEYPGDHSGFSVSLNATGSIVAIGANENDGTASDAGHARVYENISNTWIQMGNDIDGEASGDESGYSVCLAKDTLILAIGARFNDGIGSSTGHVRVHHYNLIHTNVKTQKPNNISIYPNPSTGQFTINGKDIQEIEIFDVTGKTVFNVIASETKQSIDLRDNSKGIYFVKLTTLKEVVVKKIIIK